MTRDLSIVVETRHPHATLVQLIYEAGGMDLVAVTLVDRYTGSPIPGGHVGLTYALEFRHPERTLTDADVDQLQTAIIERLQRDAQAALRTA